MSILSYLFHGSYRRVLARINELIANGLLPGDIERMLRDLAERKITPTTLRTALRSAGFFKDKPKTTESAPQSPAPAAAAIPARPLDTKVSRLHELDARLIHLSTLGLEVAGRRVLNIDKSLPLMFFRSAGAEGFNATSTEGPAVGTRFDFAFGRTTSDSLAALLPLFAPSCECLVLEIAWASPADARSAILAQLRTAYTHAYVCRLQVDAEDFDTDWNTPRTEGTKRCVFVASKAVLQNPLLVDQPPTTQRAALTRSSNTWIDVGAHKAENTLPVAQADPALTVYAFEPNTALCSALHGLVPNLLALPMAASNEDGIATFHINAYDSSSSLLPMDEEVRKEWLGGELLKEVGKQLVPTTRLDTFMARMNITHVDYLKIDAQGADYLVLQGMGDRSQDIARITAEVTITERQIYEGAAEPDVVMSHMKAIGFVVLREETQTRGQEKNWTFIKPTDWTSGFVSLFVPDETLIDIAVELQTGSRDVLPETAKVLSRALESAHQHRRARFALPTLS